ncbi:MerR family transcriptional regulator [Vagococcus teuberi]|uniref:MerR family transcriptional regulator n=1 Tax=Vagococcus teuberi TaxID=519472 RepID=A0A1J0A8M5_9ENTE|nr:MerR family transcriptional regulator [Vagococcus teuberi]APB32296.1 MerR family transcriptional regulator [Vagococcus teuberi]
MKIKEAAEMFSLPIDTLRYYERIEIIPPVKRNESGYREYQLQDLNWIFLVTNLRKAGISIESLIEFSRLAQLKDKQNVEQAQKDILNEQLDELNEKIAELTQTRELLEYKINSFDDHITQFKLGKVTPDNVEKLWEFNKKSEE